MVLKRILAVIVAVGLVAGAWFVRTNVLEDDNGTTTTTTGPVRTDNTGATVSAAPTASKALGCLAELQSVCAATGRATEAVSAALAEVPAVEQFVTFSPWDVAPTSWIRTPLASSPVVLVGRKDRIDPLKAACVDPTWSCIGDVKPQPDVRFGDPASSATGALSLAAAIAARLGRTDFGTGDLNVNPSDAAWALALRSDRKPPSDASKLAAGAAFDITATLQATAPKGAVLTSLVPTPRTVVTVVLVSKAKPDDKLVAALKAELGNKGFDPPVDPVQLPDATAIDAARSFWKNGS